MLGIGRQFGINRAHPERGTGGGANWFSQSTTSYHGGDAAKSGSISDNGQSWMQTTVSGAGIIRFHWKVSSQLGGDYLEFFIDSVRQDRR